MRYTVSTGANEPTLKYNSTILASKTKKPQLLDFILFRRTDEHLGDIVVVHRLCGLEGDVVEIRNGDLFVNNREMDSRLTLLQNFILDPDEFHKHRDLFDMSMVLPTPENSGFIVQASSATIREKNIKAKRLLKQETEGNEWVRKLYGQNWDIDHFGPVVVPKDHYFVLGDNRYGAQDSRYIGFVPKEKLVATVVQD